ncbi:MAG: TSUP family transporter [Eubacteriales bacterium]|jgi:uncharacterized membrane protein YfcA
MKPQSQKWKLLTAGFGAGLINGFFGGAGGVILVVLLKRWSGLETRKVFATSVGVTLVLSGVSLCLYSRNVELAAQWLWPCLLGGAVGGIIGGLWLKRLNTRWLQRAFALLLLLAGIKGVLGL